MNELAEGEGSAKPKALATSDNERAMHEILQVISQSRHDEGPVFDAILKNAQRLCNAPLAFLSVVNEARSHVAIPAQRGARPEFAEALKEFNEPVERTDLLAVRPATDPQVIRMDDISDDELYRKRDPRRVLMVEVEGVRSILVVPLVKDGQGIGGIVLYRREVKPFSDDDVVLAQNFAAQAVIAIENVRQFRDLQTRLEREAATKEILSVISESREDDSPVFDIILQNAERLCASPLTFLILANEDRTKFFLVANRGLSPRWFDRFEKGTPIDSPLVVARAIVEGKVFHIPDLEADELFVSGNEDRRRAVQEEGMRTLLAVPLISDGVAIGSLCAFRKEVQPFDPAQIALVETFAEQAVIAIENSRQFRELQQRFLREAASREILQIINRSRADPQPVFEAILEHGARLCSAPHAILLMRNADDTHLELAASNSAESAFVDHIRNEPHRLDNSNSIAVSALHEMKVSHVVDIRSDKRMEAPAPQLSVASEVEGMRTVLIVPLVLEGRAVGVICLYKLEVSAFSDDEIELVRTFAEQAVIAIENAHQLNALQARTQEIQALNASLEQRVQDQVGEIERMGRLKRFLPAAVADTVVSRGSDKILSSHRALLGVLFCDIRGFTAFCETAEPEETIEVLQNYHEEMGKLINDHGAGVDHRMGDGIMVLFNDPLPCDDPAGEAIRLAIAMRKRMAEICGKWKRLGHRLGFGVGVSLGYATVGMVGYEGRYDYTASGTAVNLAARLCDRAEDGEILLSPRAYTAVEGDFSGEPTGEVSLKGIREPVEVYRLLSEDS